MEARLQYMRDRLPFESEEEKVSRPQPDWQQILPEKKRGHAAVNEHLPA